jgi:hypothetical protein
VHVDGSSRRWPVCRLNATNCNAKSAGASGTGDIEWGVGGPKLLLEDGARRRLPAARNDDPHDLPEFRGERPEGTPGLLLAPEWPPLLRDAILGTKLGAKLPAATDVAALRAWFSRTDDQPTARLREVADLIGERVMLTLLS